MPNSLVYIPSLQLHSRIGKISRQISPCGLSLLRTLFNVSWICWIYCGHNRHNICVSLLFATFTSRIVSIKKMWTDLHTMYKNGHYIWKIKINAELSIATLVGTNIYNSWNSFCDNCILIVFKLFFFFNLIYDSRVSVLL